MRLSSAEGASSAAARLAVRAVTRFERSERMSGASKVVVDQLIHFAIAGINHHAIRRYRMPINGIPAAPSHDVTGYGLLTGSPAGICCPYSGPANELSAPNGSARVRTGG